MRALDQFAKFCAMIAGGFTARSSPERECNDGGGNDAAAGSRSQAAAQPTGRDGDRPRPPQVSHPAAWPR
jgi:hypothetical protein